MKIRNQKAMDIHIAYIGGGSRGWAWGLMSDLALAEDLQGTVALYDIDFEAAQHNEAIGNHVRDAAESKSVWQYQACKTIGEALSGADFVVISILPGTLDEMESDVHLPERYGIYQSVGDTTGPGGIIRALRTVPMFEEIARAVQTYCPEAWVINYTNPMAVCVDTLYRTFPSIKAFGCCHEVFGTQKLLGEILETQGGSGHIPRQDIKVNVIGVNHFTWLTTAQYRTTDLYPLYRVFAETHRDTGFSKAKSDHWMNKAFCSSERVKLDLFLRFGVIAAAGDRHLAEFCPGEWYLKNPETVDGWGFGLTTVDWRRQELTRRLQRSERLLSGQEPFAIKETGEDGIRQIRALLGLSDLITNVNLPNTGQIPNLPLGAVVETNAVFSSNSVTPVQAGPIPKNLYSMIARIAGEQQCVTTAALSRNLDLAFQAFLSDPLVLLSTGDARTLFEQMVRNTACYLNNYDLSF